MSAKTLKADEQLLEMLDNSGVKGLGLLGAKVIDIEENQRDNNRIMVDKIDELGDMLTSIKDDTRMLAARQDTTEKVVEKHDAELEKANGTLANIQANSAQEVARITGRDARTVALIGAVVGIITVLVNLLFK